MQQTLYMQTHVHLMQGEHGTGADDDPEQARVHLLENSVAASTVVIDAGGHSVYLSFHSGTLPVARELRDSLDQIILRLQAQLEAQRAASIR